MTATPFSISKNPIMITSRPQLYYGWMLSLLAVSLLGLVASTYLSVLHWQVHNVPGHVSFCAISDKLNCDTVAMSKYSVIAGLPIAYWGVLFYALIIILLIWGIVQHKQSWPWGLITLLNLWALSMSTYLLLVSEFIIHSYCLMCISIYVVNFVSAVLIGAGLYRLGSWLQQVMSLQLLAVLVGLVLFVGASLHCIEELWIRKILPLTLFLILLLVWLNRKPKQSLRQVKYILRIIAHDTTYLFHRPILGGGFAFSGLTVLIGILILTPRLYSKAKPAIPGNGILPSLGVRAPCDEKSANVNNNFALIAGGLKDIGHGQTVQGFHWIGATVPQIIIIEYSDYECPYCRKAHEIVREVVREHKNKVRLIHIQMPLDHKCNPIIRRPFHRHACKCALAAICAAEQSAFWPMNDQLFIQRGNFDFNGLMDLVNVMGLDQDRFKHCMVAKKARNILALNLEECIKHKIKPATPTFVIGGQIVMGLKDKAWWLRAIAHFEHKPKNQKSQQ
jgi:uncharacterized membrane protein/predicted DsbA family dithiol-disulfide isomerase